MSLSEPKRRELSHTRTLEIKGYARDDGLWDIEGHLTDVKPYAYSGDDTPRAAGEPIHDMWLRLTIDETFLVHEAEAFTANGPYFVCAEINPNFAALKGLRIGPGWNRNARERVGGTKGCTHLFEMLGQMGTTAMQTLWAVQAEKHEEDPDRPREAPLGLLNSCHAYRSDGPIVARDYPGSVGK